MKEGIESLAEQIRDAEYHVKEVQMEIRQMKDELLRRIIDQGAFELLKVDYARFRREPKPERR